MDVACSKRKRKKAKKKVKAQATEVRIPRKKVEVTLTSEEIAQMKENVSKLRDQFPEGQTRKCLEVEWKSVPVPKSAETAMAHLLVKRGKYNAVSESEKEAISQFIVTSKSIMTLSQAISLRAALLQDKTMDRHHKVLGRHEKEIASRYQRGQGILSLAKRYDAPPVNLFRVVLSGRGFQKSQIKQCIKNPEKHLNERDFREFQKACREDVVSSPDCQKAQEQAELFETITEQFLRDSGIAFLTQKDLVKEQKTRYGKIFASPDFLILDDLVVNGHEVRWIDCKAYYGANVKCRKKGVQTQTARYQEYWGSGAFLFLEGHSEGLLGIADCTCLSAQQFMKTHYFQPLLLGNEEVVAEENQG